MTILANLPPQGGITLAQPFQREFSVITHEISLIYSLVSCLRLPSSFGVQQMGMIEDLLVVLTRNVRGLLVYLSHVF